MPLAIGTDWFRRCHYLRKKCIDKRKSFQTKRWWNQLTYHHNFFLIHVIPNNVHIWACASSLELVHFLQNNFFFSCKRISIKVHMWYLVLQLHSLGSVKEAIESPSPLANSYMKLLKTSKNFVAQIIKFCGTESSWVTLPSEHIFMIIKKFFNIPLTHTTFMVFVLSTMNIRLVPNNFIFSICCLHNGHYYNRVWSVSQ